jgi:hypothetical protein
MRQALADFASSLNRIRALANSIVTGTPAALADPAQLSLHETQQCGAIVLLTGYFEAFIKDLVRRFIEELSTCGVPFAGFPKDIRNRHFEGGGRVLTKASEAARRRRATPFGNAPREDIVARIHSASSPSGSYQIVWEAFADTEANPSPDVVARIARDLGVGNFWRTVSRKSGDPKRWSDTAITSELSDLIAKRNECAHTGKASPVPTAADVLEFADLLESVGGGFVSALEEVLSGHRATGSGAQNTASTVATLPTSGSAPTGSPSSSPP